VIEWNENVAILLTYPSPKTPWAVSHNGSTSTNPSNLSNKGCPKFGLGQNIHGHNMDCWMIWVHDVICEICDRMKWECCNIVLTRLPRRYELWITLGGHDSASTHHSKPEKVATVLAWAIISQNVHGLNGALSASDHRWGVVEWNENVATLLPYSHQDSTSCWSQWVDLHPHQHIMQNLKPQQVMPKTWL